MLNENRISFQLLFHTLTFLFFKIIQVIFLFFFVLLTYTIEDNKFVLKVTLIYGHNRFYHPIEAIW